MLLRSTLAWDVLRDHVHPPSPALAADRALIMTVLSLVHTAGDGGLEEARLWAQLAPLGLMKDEKARGGGGGRERGGRGGLSTSLDPIARDHSLSCPPCH